ncbi:hypothetical protein DXG01_007389 [Tephrocybe rancida]|nr:hypothetical protein DXG01_007389 [Tephrocybe rancida]
MPSYSLANWDGSQSAQNTWPVQTNSRQFTPVPVGEEMEYDMASASRLVNDASMGTSSAGHFENGAALTLERAENTRVSDFSQITPSYGQNVQSIAQYTTLPGTTNVGIGVINDSTARSVESLHGLYSASRTVTDASTSVFINERVTVEAYQDKEAPHTPNLNHARSRYGSPDLADLQATNDISTIFDNDMDLFEDDNHFEAAALNLEGHNTEYPSLWTYAHSSPAVSIDVPTSIFHTPSAVSESQDSLYSPSPPPSPAPAQRVFMSHVAVPPFPPGRRRTDYRRRLKPLRRDDQTYENTVNTPRQRSRLEEPSQGKPSQRPGVKTFESLADAYEAATANNGGVYTVSRQQTQVAAGSASCSHMSASETVKRKPRQKKEQSVETLQHRRPADTEVPRAVSPAATTSASVPRALSHPPSSYRSQFGYATYDPELGITLLTIIEGISGNSFSVLSANMRFLRQWESVPVSHETHEPRYCSRNRDDHAYNPGLSSTCDSLTGIEHINVGPARTSSESGGTEDEEDGEIVFLGRKNRLPPAKEVQRTESGGTEDERDEDEEDGEIIFLGRKNSLTPAKEVQRTASRTSGSSVVPKRRIRPGTPLDDLDLLSQPFERSFSQPRAKDGVSSGKNPSKNNEKVIPRRLPSKPLQGDRALSSSGPPPRTRIQPNDIDIPFRETAKKRKIAKDDEEYRPSAKALGKRRATSREIQDEDYIHRTRLPPPPSASRHIPRSPHRRNAPTLRALSDMIDNTLKNCPMPPNSCLDCTLIPLASPNRPPVGPHNLEGSVPVSNSHPHHPTSALKSPASALSQPVFPANHPAAKPSSDLLGLRSPTSAPIASNNFPALRPPASALSQPAFPLDSPSNISSDFSSLRSPVSAPGQSILPINSVPISSSDFLTQHPSHSLHRAAVDGPFLVAHRHTDHYLPDLATVDNHHSMDWTGDTEHVFGDGTVDPTMLGGYHGDEDQDHVEEEPSSPRSPAIPQSSAFLALMAYDSDLASPSRSPSPEAPVTVAHRLASPMDSPSPLAYSPSYAASGSSKAPEPLPPTMSSTTDSSIPLIPSEPSNQRSHRTSIRPYVPDGMVATGDLDLSTDSDNDWPLSGGKQPRKNRETKKLAVRKYRAKLQSTSNSTESSEDYASDHQSSMAIVVQKQPTSAAGSLPAAWPLDKKEDYCHQCRNKTFFEKHFCACLKKYCIRCLTLGSLAQSAMIARGEVYVPLPKVKYARTNSRTPRPVQKKIAKQRPPAPSTSQHRQDDKTLPQPAAPRQVVYLAAAYGMDGEPIGNAFVGGTNEDLVVVRPLQGKSPQRPRRRIYVGEPQDSWMLSDDCRVKELHPIPWQDRNNGPNERIYIGDKARLFKPRKTKPASSQREPLPFDDGFSSPLSSLDESGDEGMGEIGAGEGESHQGLGPFVVEADFEMAAQEEINYFLAKGPSFGFSPDSLADTDVARAISLGLIACGMAVQLSTC